MGESGFCLGWRGEGTRFFFFLNCEGRTFRFDFWRRGEEGGSSRLSCDSAVLPPPVAFLATALSGRDVQWVYTWREYAMRNVGRFARNHNTRFISSMLGRGQPKIQTHSRRESVKVKTKPRINRQDRPWHHLAAACRRTHTSTQRAYAAAEQGEQQYRSFRPAPCHPP